MKDPSIRDFSVFSHLGHLGPLHWTNMHIRLFEENFEKIREFHWRNLFLTYFCTDSSSLVKVSHENSVSLRFCTIYGLKTFKTL